MKAVQKRIQSAIALLTDGDLHGLPELQATLVKLPDLRAWAFARLSEIGSALTDAAGEPLRRIVQLCVIRIDIDPHAHRGTRLVPADALAILQKEYAVVSRVKPARSRFLHQFHMERVG